MMIFTIEKIVYCDLLLTKPDLPTVEGKEMDRLEPNDLPIRDLWTVQNKETLPEGYWVS